MNLIYFKIVLLYLLVPIIITSQNKETDKVRLFYLGGQSNMSGLGSNSELPNSLNKEFKNVYIFHGNSEEDDGKNGGLGTWQKLKPGHGYGFSSDGKKNVYSDRFGIELSFAKRLSELYPDEKIALIKYCRSGSSIDSQAASTFGCWEPDYKGSMGINQYDHYLSTIRYAMKIKDIDSDGIEEQLIPSGIIWMQGESDAAHGKNVALKYYSNLKRLINLIRASLRLDDLPAVIGKISDSHNDDDGKVWDDGEIVQQAQEKFAENDKNASIVRSTENYGYSDKWHYDSKGYIDLGKNFADEIYQLNLKFE